MIENENTTLLSKREMEVLAEVAKGLSNQEIARSLMISVNTVRVHLRNIFEKLQVQSRTEATMRAIQEGWITPQLPKGEAEEEIILETEKVASAPVAVIPLARWKRIYFAIAVGIAVLVLLTPVFGSTARRSSGNPITDQSPGELSPAGSSDVEHWEVVAEMPAARSRLSAVLVNDDLYLIGGDKKSGTTGLVQVFNLDSGVWREKASKPTPGANIQGVLIADEIYVAGGCNGDGDVSDRLEIFNPQANSWRTGASLPLPLCAYAAAVVADEYYVIGGWNGADYVDSVFVYNSQEDTWRLLPEAYPQKLGFAAAAAVNGAIYVAGGYDGETEYADVNIFDTKTGDWQAGPSMQQQRGGLALVAVNQTLYAIGGGWTTLLSTSEQLSLGERAWAEFESPYVDQWRNLGAVEHGSDIVVAGGWVGEHLDSVMMYKTVYKIFIPFSY